MDLHQARCWLAVVDCGSFTRAAEVLHLSQPSVSYAVKQLEATLGVSLFERFGRGVRLTPAGEVFVAPARQLLHAADVASGLMDRFKGVETGQLTLSVVRSLLPNPLGSWISDFRVRYPEIMLRILPAGGPQIVVEQVRSGECELGLGGGALGAVELVSKKIGVQRYMAIFPPEAELPTKPLTCVKLQSYPLAMPLPGYEREVYEEHFVAAGATPHVVVETIERDLILELVLRGAVCAVVPEESALDAQEYGAQVMSFRPALKREVTVLHRDVPLSPAATTFLQAIHYARK